MFTLIITTWNDVDSVTPNTHTHSVHGFMTRGLCDEAGAEYIKNINTHDICATYVVVPMSNQA